jgi:hypothetical protein
MKTLIKFPAMMLGLLLLLTGTTQSAKAQYDDVSLQTFYDELSPYGTWINDPEYGYVWRPDVDQADFRPYYSNGRWAMTEYGNTWVSNYDWGWAPFHYGRWMYNRYNNWVWLPDTTWGPAWVDWRSGGGQYGWAPMGPSININISIGRRYIVPDFCWNFIPERHIYYNSYPRYYSGRNRVYIQNTVIINNTYVRNNRTYYSGPRADDIRRATNQNVTVYNVSRVTNRTGSNRIENNTVNVYAPRPTRGSDNAKAAPRQVVQGSVTRDRIERNGTVTREGRGGDNGSSPLNNTGRGERYSNGNVDNSNISRERGSSNPSTAPTRESRNTNDNNGGNGFGRSRERGNATTNEQNTRGVETRTTTPPTQERTERVERSRESFPSRSSSEGRSQQAAPPQRSAERAERSQPQRTERVERSQQSSGSSSRSSGATSSGRTSRGEGSGRPGRG